MYLGSSCPVWVFPWHHIAQVIQIVCVCVCARVRVRVHVLLERDCGSKPGLQVPGSVQLCGLWASYQRGHLYPQLSSGLGAKELLRLGPSPGLFSVSLAAFALSDPGGVLTSHLLVRETDPKAQELGPGGERVDKLVAKHRLP